MTKSLRSVYPRGSVPVMETTSLLEFNADLARRRQLATACGTSPGYLYLVGKKFKRAGTEMAKCIDHETARIWRRVPKETLRPDVWDAEVNNKNAQTNEVEGAQVRRKRT